MSIRATSLDDANSLSSCTGANLLDQLKAINNSALLQDIVYPLLIEIANRTKDLDAFESIAQAFVVVLQKYQLTLDQERLSNDAFDLIQMLTKKEIKQILHLLFPNEVLIRNRVEEILYQSDVTLAEEMFSARCLIPIGNQYVTIEQTPRANIFFGDAAYNLLTEFFYCQYIHAGNSFGIFSAIATEPKTTYQLAQECGVQEAILDLMMRTLLMIGYLDLKDGGYVANDKTKACVQLQEEITLITTQIYDDSREMTEVLLGNKKLTLQEEDKKKLQDHGLYPPLLALLYDDIESTADGRLKGLNTHLLGFLTTQVIASAVELGIIEKLGQAECKLEELTETSQGKIAPEKLTLIMQYLEYQNLVIMDRGHVSLTTAGRIFLKDNEISLVNGAQVLSQEFFKIWRYFNVTLQTGKPATSQAFSEGFFDYLDSYPIRRSLFGAYMGETMKMWLLPLSNKYNFHGKVIDLGGADSGVLKSILRDNPAVTKAVNFEKKGYFNKQDADERIVQMEGDFFESVPEGYDQYILSRILWDWDDEHCLQLLQNIHKVIADEATVVIVDGMLSDSNTRGNLGSAMFMPIVTEGKVRSKKEWQALFKKANFTMVDSKRVHDSMMALSMMVLKKVD